MEHKWVQITNNNIPGDAFRGGYDGINALYVARATDPSGNVVGGKASSSFVGCRISYEGREIEVKVYDVLTMSPYQTKNYVWMYSREGKLPEGAVVTDNVGRYVARVASNGTITPGKFKSGDNMAYIPYGGNELSSRNFEILCHRPGDVPPHTSA